MYVLNRSVEILIITLLLSFNLNGGITKDTDYPKGISAEYAVRECLKANYSIKQSRAGWMKSRSRLQELKGDFDLNFQLKSFHSGTEDSFLQEKNFTTGFGFGVNKLLPNGILLGTNITGTRRDYRDSGNSVKNYGEVDFIVEIPLLKNGGKESVYAEVDAAKWDTIAENYNLKDQICRSVRDTLITYWNYVVANMVLQERIKAERRAEKLIADSRELIKREEVAPAEIIQYQGNLGNKVSARVAQEQSLFEVKLELGKNMGLSLRDSVKLPLPSEGFPELNSFSTVVSEDFKIFDEDIRRYDFMALKAEIKSAEILLKASKKDTRSDLRVKLKAGYTGQEGGRSFGDFWRAPVNNIGGINFNAGLTYNWSGANNIRKGIWKQKHYDLKKINFVKEELALDIRMNCLKFFNRISCLMEQFRSTQKSTENYEKALKNEQIKYKMNMSTQINIIETEENFMEAAIRKIRVRKELVEAIINLWYASGRLGRFEGGKFIVNRRSLLSLPKLSNLKINK